MIDQHKSIAKFLALNNDTLDAMTALAKAVSAMGHAMNDRISALESNVGDPADIDGIYDHGEKVGDIVRDRSGRIATIAWDLRANLAPQMGEAKPDPNPQP